MLLDGIGRPAGRQRTDKPCRPHPPGDPYLPNGAFATDQAPTKSNVYRTGKTDMGGFLTESVGCVALLVGAACVGTGGAALLIEILSRRK